MKKTYQKEDLTISWEPKKCIHSAVCINGLPQVFDTSKKPWVNIDGASRDEIEKQVLACPSKALSIIK